MKMDMKKFQAVIDSKKLPVEFTSHEFLQVYTDMFEEDYTRNISAGKGAFRKLHGPIGSYLRRKEKELGIQKIATNRDKNVKGNLSKCAWWKKTKK